MPLGTFGDLLLDQILQQKRSSLFSALFLFPESHSSSQAALIWSLITAKLHPVNFKRRAGSPAWGAVNRWASTDRGFISATRWSCAVQSRVAWRKSFLCSLRAGTPLILTKWKINCAVFHQAAAKSNTQRDKRHLCGSSAQSGGSSEGNWG